MDSEADPQHNENAPLYTTIQRPLEENIYTNLSMYRPWRGESSRCNPLLQRGHLLYNSGLVLPMATLADKPE